MMKSHVWIILLVYTVSSSSATIFSIEPKDQTVPLHSTAEIQFSCRADVANPTYFWRKDMQLLDTVSVDSRYGTYGGTLVISSPQPSDEGFYQCVMSNANGRVISNGGRLTFAYINPFPSTEERLISTNAGSGVIIPCNGADYAPLNLQTDILTGRSVNFYWESLRKWHLIKPPGNSTHYVSQKTGTLYLSSPTVADQDLFSCGVRSTWTINGMPVNIQSSIYRLEVSKSTASIEPTFLLQPTHTVAVFGGNALMECFASGLPTPIITWHKEDGMLPPNHIITPAGQLLIINITEQAAGTYRCKAFNSEGDISATGVLELENKPRWEKEISSQSADLSTATTFICKVSAKPNATLKWYKDGQELTAMERIMITADETLESILHIDNVADADQGMYQCVASNAHGSIFSSAKLTVNSFAPTFIHQVPEITKATEGSNTVITCEVNAAPKARISWEKDDQDLVTGNNKYLLEENGSLQIRNLVKSDEGEYTCKASNILDRACSEGHLKIYDPLSFIYYPKNTSVNAGDSMELVCKATFDPRLNLGWRWRHNQEPVDRKNFRYKLNGGSLLFTDAISEQTGTYECCAVTDVGSACAKADVSVLAPPDPPSNVNVISSSDTWQHITWQKPKENGGDIIEYHVEGKNVYDEVWKNMITIPELVEQSECNVTALLPFVGYQYRISASNEYGRGQPSQPSVLRHTLSGKPTLAPSGLREGESIPGKLIVQWEPLARKFYGAADIDYVVVIKKKGQGFTVSNNLDQELIPFYEEMRLQEKVALGGKSNTITFSVNASEIYVPYEAKVRATNPFGNSAFSETVIVHTAELAPETPPTGIHTEWKQAYSAQLSWDRLESKHGYTKGYKLRVCEKTKNCDNSINWKNLTTVDEQPKILVKQLKANMLYSVQIAGFNTGGLGVWSSKQLFLTEKKPPSISPTQVEVRLHSRSLSAKWKPVPETGILEGPIKGYVVQYWFRHELHSEAHSYYTERTDVEFQLPQDGEYNVWVRAFNAGGMGTPSNTFTVSTLMGSKIKLGGSACAVKSSLLQVASVACLLGIINLLL